MWQGFGSERGVFCEKKLPTYLIKPLPAGCKRELLLPEAEPIGNGGHDSGITFEKNKNSAQQYKERSENM